MKAVLIEGASTAYGAGDPENGGWGALLHRDAMRYTLENPEDPVVIANFAYPGRTIWGTKKYLEQDIERLKSPGALAVIISTGINEAKINPGNSTSAIPLASFNEALHQCIDIADKHEAKTIFMGPQRIDSMRTCPPIHLSVLHQDTLNKYRESVATVAAERGAEYIDLNVLQQPYSMDEVIIADGLHPTQFGHELLYEAAQDKLMALGAIWMRNSLLKRTAAINS